MAKTKVQGTDKLIQQLKQFGAEGQREIADRTEQAAFLIKARAAALVPKNNGKVRDSIQPERIDATNWEVVARSSYAGYIEFGTGPKVDVPAEFAELANAWKNNPKGTFEDGLIAMKDWCHNKGLPEENAWIYLMNVIKHGQQPRPFMYPAFVEGKVQYRKDLTKSLEELTKRFNNAR